MPWPCCQAWHHRFQSKFAMNNSLQCDSKTAEGHGWIGLRFQSSPNEIPSDFIIHVILHDQDAKLQQETVGIIGTNILHACFNETDPKEILKRSYDSLEKEQFEINILEIQSKYVDDKNVIETEIDSRSPYSNQRPSHLACNSHGFPEKYEKRNG